MKSQILSFLLIGSKTFQLFKDNGLLEPLKEAIVTEAVETRDNQFVTLINQSGGYNELSEEMTDYVLEIAATLEALSKDATWLGRAADRARNFFFETEEGNFQKNVDDFIASIKDLAYTAMSKSVVDTKFSQLLKNVGYQGFDKYIGDTVEKAGVELGDKSITVESMPIAEFVKYNEGAKKAEKRAKDLVVDLGRCREAFSGKNRPASNAPVPVTPPAEPSSLLDMDRAPVATPEASPAAPANTSGGSWVLPDVFTQKVEPVKPAAPVKTPPPVAPPKVDDNKTDLDKWAEEARKRLLD
jgi:hypothetical protein